MHTAAGVGLSGRIIRIFQSEGFIQSSVQTVGSKGRSRQQKDAGGSPTFRMSDWSGGRKPGVAMTVAGVCSSHDGLSGTRETYIGIRSAGFEPSQEPAVCSVRAWGMTSLGNGDMTARCEKRPGLDCTMLNVTPPACRVPQSPSPASPFPTAPQAVQLVPLQLTAVCTHCDIDRFAHMEAVGTNAHRRGSARRCRRPCPSGSGC